MTYLLLNTAEPLCKVIVIADNGEVYSHEWQADRELAHGLLRYINETLALHDSSIKALSGIGVFAGPGSFTGLRIGITVVNTLADSLGIPIVGTTDSEWVAALRSRLIGGENDQIVLPFYGREARITTPRK